ncbi:IS3 family transposase [Tellurirhabdus rosea]|uniref:IS3 family transposase n=1 Tax=Tellurirhabdus rosea TaxID=2674997 RepID=UPI002B1CC2F7|nr:IS3 family transposase [Tellurirhabdus rosea]
MEKKVSVGRACRVVGMHRSRWYYQNRKNDQPVIDKLQAYAEAYPTRGFDDYYGKIRNEGLVWNRKRVLRVYRLLKLKHRRRHKRRLPARVKKPLQVPQAANHCWSMDFVADALVSKRKIRVLTIMDDYSREVLAAHADFSLPAQKVVDVLKDIALQRPLPKRIRVDNGAEFIADKFTKWCTDNNIEILYIQPGKPMQNGYIERLNRTFREDVLDAYLFESLEEVRILSDEWMDRYNRLHPHQSLGGLAPATYARQTQTKV